MRFYLSIIIILIIVVSVVIIIFLIRLADCDAISHESIMTDGSYRERGLSRRIAEFLGRAA